jgi:hypothetical protein
MIRMTWLQFRTQAAVAIGGLVILAAVLAFTGPHLVHLYDTIVTTCAAHGDCSTAGSAFLKNDRSLQIGLDALVVIMPGVIGLFWGPPLVAREFETSTFRLAWTQSVTRIRWLAVKLGVIGLASMAVAGLVSLVVTWWSSPVDLANMTAFTTFDQRDIVPIGYAAFAFALGVTAGVLIRRTLAAIATALAAFVAVRLSFDHWLRPHLLAPIHRFVALNLATVGLGSYSPSGPVTLKPIALTIPNGWVYSTQIVARDNHALSAQFVARACPSLAQSTGGATPSPSGLGKKAQVPESALQALQACATKVGKTYRELVTYQPGSHFWPLQWYELGIYLVVALILAAICVLWVRRLAA